VELGKDSTEPALQILNPQRRTPIRAVVPADWVQPGEPLPIVRAINNTLPGWFPVLELEWSGSVDNSNGAVDIPGRLGGDYIPIAEHPDGRVAKAESITIKGQGYSDHSPLRIELREPGSAK
jgi:hypothetical protein